MLTWHIKNLKSKLFNLSTDVWRLKFILSDFKGQKCDLDQISVFFYIGKNLEPMDLISYLLFNDK